MLIKPMNMSSLNDLLKATDDFFDMHWSTNLGFPPSWKTWHFEGGIGGIPYHDKQGC